VAGAGPQVRLMLMTNALDVELEVGDERDRQRCESVFATFAVAHADFATLEVDVFHAQSGALEQAEAGAVEQGRHEAGGAVEARKERRNLGWGEHYRDSLGAFGADERHLPLECDGEHFVVEEEKGSQGLVLGARAHVAFAGEVVEEGSNLGGAHAARVPLAVMDDEAPDPVAVSTLRFRAVVTSPQGKPDEVEQLGIGVNHGVRVDFARHGQCAVRLTMVPAMKSWRARRLESKSKTRTSLQNQAVLACRAQRPQVGCDSPMRSAACAQPWSQVDAGTLSSD
jgi:hypothetical protein